MDDVSVESDVLAAIKEFIPLYDELTASDLQGIVYARAKEILHSNGSPCGFDNVAQLSDQILQGIYDV
jgi:hypothetical protein